MLTADFDYYLPEELIAQRPPEVRGTSRMMVLNRKQNTLEHKSIGDILDYLRPGDLMILNNTRVFPARILGAWEDTGGAAELLLLDCREREAAIEGGFTSQWRCMCGSGRKSRVGHTILCAQGNLRAEVLDKDEEGHSLVRFHSAKPLMALLDAHGLTPVPPYIRRDANDPEMARLDKERYQTVYAKEVGAVAAPTAGLHFTDELLTKLEAKGIKRAFVTLHVGPGTFKPVKADRVEEHRMDAEFYDIPEATAQAIRETRAAGGRIVAVGSTSVRTLETVAALNNGEIVATHGSSTAFIYPPYQFKAIDVMLTNFHLPQSTLIMMISALAGRERVLAAYEEAVKERYRFFSYGDCMLIL
ncbi:MAG: tRNA preQ1(34) S-adenosylmethionine ribosyltransferase-isomerase QueA [Kiritimatiellae bacterium]|nr:tRNA preQ1(34) S-adenosylmethionine ribosyltransferase-isomerase QueA [Kiritimatiellia bacterium]